MKQGFLGGLIVGGLLAIAAKTMMKTQNVKIPTRWVRQGRDMMNDANVDEWIGRSRKVARKTGRRILRTMSR
jgi:hypothetical protein